MKIKSVCELTGLSDRTVRYYIEENLISPSYTENYLGRKTYDFSEKDITELNNIAVLRKFDFTIEEIRDLINNPEKSSTILCNVRSRTEKTVLDGQDKLSALSQISTEKAYTVAELADELSKASLPLHNHNEPIKVNIVKTIFSILKAVATFIIVWSPIALSLFAVIKGINYYSYPVFEPKIIALTIAYLSPSIAILIISKMDSPWKKIVKRILLVLCVLSIPLSFIASLGIISRSETTDIKNYCYFDATCSVERNGLFQELFPSSPHYIKNVKQEDGSWEAVYLDAHYYYHYFQGLDYTCDIYAEWPLDEGEYIEEVNRATAIFEKMMESQTLKFVKLTKGDYTCLILYRNGMGPFNKEIHMYDYTIFAYNDINKTVRYIYCASFADGDQPYYLQLDW